MNCCCCKQKIKPHAKGFIGFIKKKAKDGSSGWELIGYLWPTKSGEGCRESFLEGHEWTNEDQKTHVKVAFWV